MQKFLYFILTLAFVIPNASFAASGLPAIESKLVKNITYNSATVYATLSAGTAEDNAYWFEWGVVGSDEEGEVFKTTRRLVSTRSGQREVYAYLKGLSPNKQYYFRGVAENQAGEISGNVIYFTTRELEDKTESITIATTRNVVNIKDESATIYGYVAPHNSTAKYWFDFGTTTKVEFSTRAHSMGRLGGETSEILKDLTPGTTYYYRQAAESERGVVYGELKSFKTKGIKPAVETKKEQTSPALNTKVTKAENTTSKTITNKSLLGNMFGGSNSEDEKDTKTTKSDVSKTKTGEIKDVSVSVKTIAGAGNSQTVEYKITYKYNRKESATKAELRTTLPKSVLYAGDTTNGEMLVTDSTLGSKTYILPIGDIQKGDTGTVSIVAVLASGTKSAPDVKSELAFNSKSEGTLIAGSVVASVASSNSQMAFPTTLIMWIVFLILVLVVITFALKARDLYAAAQLKVAEEKKKTEEITKTIETNLSKQDELNYGSQKDELPLSSNLNPVPVKPKVVNEYENTDALLPGLPGMEVV